MQKLTFGSQKLADSGNSLLLRLRTTDPYDRFKRSHPGATLEATNAILLQYWNVAEARAYSRDSYCPYANQTVSRFHSYSQQR
ncbi:hypothetical protein H6F76_10890 [Leptolyngbya sp. FACHB-321]|uniref:hypothetical protein n=1 Tax=Leptolyngbya sp. FACHB-321 TaxID=2692807 RepID=UPI0016840245|nr:hypothetical protein [Leptolyngbya sp. FACHB-321]MBD2035523.1 hypothetical protein [Leptolyngbya sp. FACHB-321]